MDCDDEELKATKNKRNKCEFCHKIATNKKQTCIDKGNQFYRIFLPPNQQPLLNVELDGKDIDGYRTSGFFKINYCPMCGRKLVMNNE